MEPPKENNAKEHTLIYIPRAYLPADTGAIGFIFNDENEERPKEWKRAHVVLLRTCPSSFLYHDRSQISDRK